MDGTLTITKACQRAVLSDIQSEAVTGNTVKFFNNLTCGSIKALGTNCFITAASENKVLIGDEAHTVDNWVQDVVRWGYIPDHLLDWALEVAEVPNLHTFAESATSSHNIVVILRNIDAVATD